MRNILLLTLFFGLTACLGSSDSSKKNTPIGEVTPVGEQGERSVLTLNGATATQLTLPNSLKVTLISSPTSKKAAASVAVKVGHKDNPVEAQGLAHYLEHMLFLGTDEFPIVGDYKKFLDENNGGSNAYTSTDHTNYFLEVRPDKFDEAVHRLSRFFVSPKFYPENIDQEKNAVHNEFNFRFEAFKPGRVFSAFQKEDSAGRLFSVGNKESLEMTTAEDTRKFFEEHYHTEAMHAILAGPQSIKELEVLAKKYFSDFKSNPNKALNKHDQFLTLDFEQLPAKVNLKPQGQEKKLSVFIPVMNPKAINPKLANMMGTLIGDESNESLMVYLQEKGLVRDGGGALSGGMDASGASITVHLTDKGVEKQRKILRYIKGYLKFLKKEGLPAYLNNELTKSEKADKVSRSFYEIKGDALQDLNGSYMGEEVFPQTVEELFFGKQRPDVTNEEYVDLLKSLEWDKVLVTFTHPDNEEVAYEHTYLENIELGGLKVQEVNGQRTVTDSLYKFAFSVDDVKVNKIKAKGKFELKKENIYIPEKFDLYTENQPEVYTKKAADWGVIYYSPLVGTNLPKAYSDLSIYSEAIDFTSNEDVVSLYLLRELLRSQTASSTYAMLLAGFEMSFPINPVKGSLGVSFYGWSDTFIKAFSDMISFTSFKPSVEEFEKAKGIYTHNLKIEEAGGVSDIGVREMRAQIEHARLSYQDTKAALLNVDHTKFMNFVERYKSGLHIKGALSGNVKESYIESLVSALEEKWQPTWAKEESWASLYKLESVIGRLNSEGELPLYETSVEGNHPEEVFYYGYWNFGEASGQKEKWVSRILGDWLAPDYYTELRTKRGLAYGLGAWGFEHSESVGIGAYLQSSTHLVDEIETQVGEYLQTWTKEVLPTKTADLLQRTVDSYMLEHKMPAEPQAIHGRYSRYVDKGYQTLEEADEVLAPLSEITLEEVIGYGAENLNGDKRGSFVKVSRKQDVESSESAE